MSARYVRIKDCADVHPGFSIKTKVVHESKGTHQVIIAKHLTEDAPYNYQHEQELRITPARPTENYLLKPDDILFMSRGARNVATLLLSFPQPAIAPSTFYILRSKKNIAEGCLEKVPKTTVIKCKKIQFPDMIRNYKS